MSDSIVPIRPGVDMKPGRTRKLLEHVAERLVQFAADNDEEPASIVFVIMGERGTLDHGYLIEDYYRAMLALAGALLAEKALNPDE